MNHVFRIIWSKTLRTWVVASELATRDGKGGGGVDERETGAASSARFLATEGWRLRVCAAAVLLTLYAPAWAADRWWDPNGTALGQGGTDTWNTTSAFWNAFNDGTSGPMHAWNNAAPGGDNAFFLGTASPVTLAGTINVHNLNFQVGGYTLSDGTLNLVGTAPTINTAGNTVINSAIAGSAGLTKTGAGTLTLQGTNSFTGGLTISAGRVNISGDAALGAASNNITLADGTRIDSAGAVNSNRVVTLLGGSATAVGGVLSARFTGAGGLNPAGTLSNDANDYTGATNFFLGTHGFTSIADLGIASSLGAPTTAATGLITLNAGGGLGSALIYFGDGDSSNRDWRFNNTTVGGNVLQNSGTGTLRLTGNLFVAGGNWTRMVFDALSADMELLGEISGAGTGRHVSFSGGAGRTITLGNANTFDGTAGIRPSR